VVCFYKLDHLGGGMVVWGLLYKMKQQLKKSLQIGLEFSKKCNTHRHIFANFNEHRNNGCQVINKR
jgi:hypothetical protein